MPRSQRLRQLCFYAGLPLAFVVVATATDAQEPAGSKVVTATCLVRPYDEIEVPAQREGVLRHVKVRRADTVDAGDVIAFVDDGDAQASFAVARARHALSRAKAENQWPVEVAESQAHIAATEQRLIEELGQDAAYLERARAANNRRRTEAELKSESSNLNQARLEERVAFAELNVARRNIDQRLLVAPAPGSIVSVNRQEGEWVEAGTPVVTLLRMDELLAECMIDAADIPPHQVTGMPVSVSLQIAEGETVELTGLTVSKAAPKVDLDGRYLVWIRIQNRQHADASGAAQWLIRPGMSGAMTIQVAPTTSLTRRVRRPAPSHSPTRVRPTHTQPTHAQATRRTNPAQTQQHGVRRAGNRGIPNRPAPVR